MATVLVTPPSWTNLVPGKVISLADLGDNLAGRLRSAQWTVQADLWGDGGTIDAVATWVRASSKLSQTTSEAVAYTPTGHRLNLATANALNALTSVPFEDDGASTYRILGRWNDYPTINGGVAGTDGQPHYPQVTEGLGRIVNPDSVTQDAGTGDLTLTLTGQLYDGEKWAALGDTRLALVWYADPVHGGPYRPGSGGVQPGQIAFDGADYAITLAAPHLLLDNPAHDLDAANYRVMILGPTIEKVGTDTIANAGEFVELSRVVGTSVDPSFAPVINSVGTWIAAFNVQHDSTTGVHLDVTADTVQVEATADVIQNPLIVVKREDGTSMTELRSDLNTGGNHAGELAFVNIDSAASGKARIACYTVGAVESILEITRPATQSARLVVDGRIRKNSVKTGIPFAIQADDAADELLTFENVGAGVLDLEIAGGELDWSGAGRLNGTNSGVGHFMIELDVGTGCTIDAVGNITGLTVDATQGFTANPVTHAAGYGYASGEEPTIRQDFPAYAGGWSPTNNPGTIYPVYSGTTPIYVGPSVIGTALVLRLPLEEINRANLDAGVTITIDQIDLDYYKQAAGDAVSLQLKRFKRDRTGAVGVVATVTASTTAAWTTGSASSLAHVVDGTYVYWLELSLTATSVIADARAGNVAVHFTKDAIE